MRVTADLFVNVDTTKTFVGFVEHKALVPAHWVKNSVLKDPDAVFFEHWGGQQVNKQIVRDEWRGRNASSVCLPDREGFGQEGVLNKHVTRYARDVAAEEKNAEPIAEHLLEIFHDTRNGQTERDYRRKNERNILRDISKSRDACNRTRAFAVVCTDDRDAEEAEADVRKRWELRGFDPWQSFCLEEFELHKKVVAYFDNGDGSNFRNEGLTPEQRLHKEHAMRGVLWIADRLGTKFKSEFLKYVRALLGVHQVQCFDQSEDLTAIRLQLDPHCEFFCFNLPRGADPSPKWYELLEAIKDGLVDSPKYKSCQKNWHKRKPFILVLANDEPRVFDPNDETKRLWTETRNWVFNMGPNNTLQDLSANAPYNNPVAQAALAAAQAALAAAN